MNKGYIKLLIFSLLTCLLLIINSVFNILNIYTYILFLFCLLIIIRYLFGFWKAKSIHKDEAVLMIIAVSLIYYFVTYLCGILIGFSKNIYDLSILGLIRNLVPLIIIISLEELIRHSLVKPAFKYKSILIITTIMMSLMEMTLIFGTFDFNNLSRLVEFSFVYFLPIIIRNIFLTYLTLNIDYKPSITYRLLFDLNIYILPIIPALGLYIGSVIKVVLPLVLMYIVYIKFYDKKDKTVLFNNRFTKLAFATTVFIVIGTVMLVSGWFKYYALTIGSGSMDPKIKVGDVVIVEKLSKKNMEKLEIGEILVFKSKNKIVVHRIHKILEYENTIVFITKGDANELPDTGYVKKEDVIGKVKLKISYIGYPTIKLNELMNK